MSGYGFRLYEVKLVAGWGKSKAIEFDKCGLDGKQHVGTWMRRVLAKLESFDALDQMPQARHAEDTPLKPIDEHLRTGQRDDPRIDFHEHTTNPATRIRFEFSYGRIGRVPFAIGDTPAAWLDLKRHAAGNRYRGLFYLPSDGFKGLLALETIPSSAHPVESLNAWLARAAVEVFNEDVSAVAAKPEGERDGLRPAPFKLNFKQLVNYERLSKMIKETSDVELVLRRTTIGKGSKKNSEKVRLVTKIDTQVERHKAVQVAQSLYGKVVGTDDDDTAGLAELESLVPSDVSGLEFNDGYIKVDDGNNGVKKIGIDTIDRYFNYPVGSSLQLPSDKWEQRVAAEVVSLQTLMGVELDVS